MQSTNEQLSALQQQMEALALEQEQLNQKILLLNRALHNVKEATAREEKIPFQPTIAATTPSPRPVTPPEPTQFQRNADFPARDVTPVPAPFPRHYHAPSLFEKVQQGTDFEKFIGENIISKIGIIITVIGVGIGTKYAIDNDLLSPLARIILGYLLGIGILGFAIYLKEKYENFSAVLLSGAMAIFYLITLAAYSFYQLIPQPMAFALMVIFTVFTVTSAIYYNRQWIALLGLVGAYGIPFLLSEDSGQVHILFSYMALLNIGILAVAVKRYWRILDLTAFGLTWLIFMAWFTNDYVEEKHFSLALLFASVFFLIFYCIFLVHKLVEKRMFHASDVILLLANSFIFYGIGFITVNDHPTAERFAGLFTLANAMIHFAIAVVIFRMKLADRNLFYLVAGLVLVFLTLAVPVQFDGGWVTLTWAAEAALLFWIGRSRQVFFYETISYPLMALAVFSQIEDWSGLSLPGNGLPVEENIQPILNAGFLMSMLVIAAFVWITYNVRKYPPEEKPQGHSLRNRYESFFGNVFPPAAIVFLMYFTFRYELIHFWQIQYGNFRVIDNNFDSYAYDKTDPTLTLLKVWILNYSLVFVAIGGIINRQWTRVTQVSNIFMATSLLLLFIFSAAGLLWLNGLLDMSLKPDLSMAQIATGTVLKLRYISLACAAVLLAVMFQYRRQEYGSHKKAIMAFDLFLHFTIVATASYELITWLKLNGSQGFDKLGLSILWGAYALVLIGLGIFLRKQHLRIAAIVLFAITLIKLFFYDLAYMTTIGKTVVFISLGILLLIISFLYNKYKNKITGPDEN